MIRARGLIILVKYFEWAITALRQKLKGGRMTFRVPLLVLSAFFLTVMPPPARALNKSYTFSTIEVPGADNTSTNAINNHGQIVGIYAVGGRTHGFLLDNGQFSTIDHPAGDVFTHLSGINNKGQIVGTFLGHDGLGSFVLYKDIFTPIEVPGSDNTFVGGINNKGQFVGWYSEGGSTHGFLLDAGVYTTLPDPVAPGVFGTMPSGINRRGQIVGTYEFLVNGSAAAGGFLLQNDVFTYIVHPDGESDTEVRGINNHAQIVGLYDTFDGITHAFVFTTKKGFTAVDFPGALATGATGINRYGHVVGYYQTVDKQYGFVAVPNSAERSEE